MAADPSADHVDLTDLDVISRYSLAVRTATAPVDDVIAVLRADLDWLEGMRGRGRGAAPARRATTAKKASAAKRPAAAKPGSVDKPGGVSKPGRRTR